MSPTPGARNRPTLTRAAAPDLSLGTKSDEKAKSAAGKDKAPGGKDKGEVAGPHGKASSSAVAKAGIGPASGPSRRQPAVATTDKGKGGTAGLLIAIGVAVVAVAAVGVLHWLKIIAIPGL